MPATDDRPVRILYLEDNRLDAELLERMLDADGMSFELQVVESESAFAAALDGRRFDLILSDYSIPGFDGMSALLAARAKCHEIPFVFVSGSIGEERAIDAVRMGATDYVLKHRLSRLIPTLKRALAEKAESVRRMQAEAAFERLRRQTELILSSAGEGIYGMDLLGRITFINPAAARMLGIPAEEALGQLADEVVSHSKPDGTAAPRSECPSHATAQQGRSLRVDDQVFRKRDGTSFPVEFLSSPLREGEAVAGAVVTFLDITERKRAEEMQAQFLRSQRLESIGTLAGGIAHDLNNVLSPILMAADVLQRHAQDERSRSLLASIQSSCQRGADMVRQILTFARGMDGERSVLDPLVLLEDVFGLVRETFPSNVEVRASLADDVWPITGDATQLHQVLLNLSVNARDAMPRGGLLSLAALNVVLDESCARESPEARPGPYVMLTVADTGTGILSGISERIFEPFFTTKEAGKGTGLGLSTTRKIVRGHGGFIQVLTEVGKGTEFKVYLPATLPVQPAATTEPRELPLGNGQLILVVDDEASMCRLVKDTLESYGYRVLTALDGSEAVALYAKSRREVAVVVTDLRMPVMDGPATVRALRRIDPNVKVIVSTGCEDVSLRAEIADGLAQAFLQKPFTAERLLTTVKSVLLAPPPGARRLTA